MTATKSSKKALALVLILITVGTFSAYFAYDLGQDTEEMSVNTNQTLASQPIENNILQEDQEGSISEEVNQAVLVSNEEEVIETMIVKPVVSSGPENNISEKPITTNTVSDKKDLAEVTEKVEVKMSEQLVKTEEAKIIAEEKIEKVVVDNSAQDPFDLFISSEMADSDVFEKYDYGIYINSVKQSNGKIVDGSVQIYDNIRSKRISTIKTHTLAGVNDPKNRSQSVRIISTVFGYRPQEVSFSLNEPSNYVSKTESFVSSVSDSVIRVDLRLERLQAGDIAVMWKVFFFKDAAIMQSKSKPELEDLHAMMKENHKMKIKLHGHTNGNSHGKVIHLGESDNDDFFNIKSPKHVETMGTAQKLSLYRAETIEHYLLSKGIDQSRVEIKGWGGKKMLHDKHSAQANLNVRVEVEILEN